jgi:hypothetical protein
MSLLILALEMIPGDCKAFYRVLGTVGARVVAGGVAIVHLGVEAALQGVPVEL